jgi:hypothetical protein
MERMISDLDQEIHGLPAVERGQEQHPEQPRGSLLPPTYRSSHSPHIIEGNDKDRYRLLKKAQQKKLTPDEFREQAIYEIFCFYARQHIRKGIDFD